MRDLIRKLGHIKTVIAITIFAIIVSEALAFILCKLFSFPYITPALPLITFLVPLIVVPLSSWHLLKLLIELDQKEIKMYNLATYDSMTKLLSRQAFFKRSMKLHDSFEEENKSYFVCIIDIDDFKAINDTYGHAYGDDVLSDLGDTFLKTFQDTYIIGRIGGEEFAMVMDADEQTVEKEMEKLHEVISKTKVPFRTGHIQYTVSIGMFENKTPKHINFDEALSHADDALYDAKVTGKNKTVKKAVIYTDAKLLKNLPNKSAYLRSRKK